MVWINGEPQERVEARDRAVQFGDGCFTTARILEGKVVSLKAHLSRLKAGCERLMIRNVDWDALAAEMQNAAATRSDGVLKAIVSRGAGGRGYSALGCEQPSRMIFLSDYPAHYQRLRQTGARLALSTVRLGKNPLLAGIKHLNRLEQVLIRTELDQTAADEALVLDSDGSLVECCAANLFWRKGDQIFTPDLSQCGVNGIQRQKVIQQLHRLGMPVQEVSLPVETLAEAEEVFITNALMPVLPVSQIDCWHYASRAIFNLLRLHDD
ncbi:aminodeoxychorismate lyase [Erwinia sp. MMLR14_017]|uniref:aminodeoxychorismate lyase n=1 Tax=Erwinia sp. MMLR14_017 TaxID=3093842 RepID=UPI00298F4793|nr:aminodeoxychorismate lyase [Erwinia sp. MMLR14_017]MDW8847520.1 aminodeoxychorismate lyase [Erwinia sp. MMLR14_017]